MENKTPVRLFMPILAIFGGLTAAICAPQQKLTEWGIDWMVLAIGNLILFLATAISFAMYFKAIRTANVQVFLRMLYGSLLVKMLFSLAATLLYVFLAGKSVNKLAVIGCFGIYIIYTFAEVKIIMRLSKQQKNA